MPRPPAPNAIRAMIGFPIWFVIGALVVGVVRHFLQGIPAYFVPLEIMDGFFAGWFYDDEATFMFALIFGAAGFIWGSGGMYDFKKEAARPVVVRERIPRDPDAPRFQGNPLGAMFDSIPAMGLAIGVLVLTTVLLAGVPAFGTIPLLGSSTQTTNESAERDQFGTDSYNFLGVVEIEDASQEVLFFGFAAVVIFLLINTAIGIAFVMYLLNRQVTVASKLETSSQQGEDFILIKLIRFFTDWAIDILEGMSAMVRPR